MSDFTTTINPVASPAHRGKSVAKKNAGPGRPPSGKPPSRQVSVRIPAELDARLQKFIEDQRVQPSDTAVILVALEQLLTQEGYPAPDAD